MLNRTIPTLFTFFGDAQRLNSHKWHPIRQLNDDICNTILSVPLKEGILNQTVPEEESKDVIQQKIAAGAPIKKYILESAWNSRAIAQTTDR